MVRTALALALAIALATSASAYDRLYTGGTAAVAEAPSFGIEGSALFFIADSAFDADGESQDWPDGTRFSGKWFPVKIWYVPAPGLEVGVSPIFRMDTMEFASIEDDYSGTGIGDTWAWARYSFSDEPVLSARLGAKLPTGNDEVLAEEEELILGSGQTDIDLSLMVGLPAGEGLLDVAFGYRLRMERGEDDDVVGEVSYAPGVKPGDEIHFLLGYSHRIGEAVKLRLGADGFFGAEPTKDGESIPSEVPGENEPAMSGVFINPGVDYVFQNGVRVGVDVHYPLMGASIEKHTGFGITVGFNS